jgi:putative spermidine/putrescine transport system permease protein
MASNTDAPDRPRRRVPLAALLVAPGLLWLAVALGWPYIAMLHVSFSDAYPAITSYTLKHYVDFLQDSYLLGVALRTFALAFTVVIVCAVIGYPLAYYLAHSRSPYRKYVFLCVVSPLLVSTVVRTIGWTILLGDEGLINNMLKVLHVIDDPLTLMKSFWSVVVGMVHILLPFMVLSIMAVLSKVDSAFSEAAKSLGATPVAAFFRVTLPLSINGVAAGSVIVFCLTIGSYITPLWLGRGKVPVLANSIYDQMIVIGNYPAGAALSIVLTIAMLVVLTIYGLILRKHSRR